MEIRISDEDGSGGMIVRPSDEVSAGGHACLTVTLHADNGDEGKSIRVKESDFIKAGALVRVGREGA